MGLLQKVWGVITAPVRAVARFFLPTAPAETAAVEVFSFPAKISGEGEPIWTPVNATLNQCADKYQVYFGIVNLCDDDGIWKPITDLWRVEYDPIKLAWTTWYGKHWIRYAIQPAQAVEFAKAVLAPVSTATGNGWNLDADEAKAIWNFDVTCSPEITRNGAMWQLPPRMTGGYAVGLTFGDWVKAFGADKAVSSDLGIALDLRAATTGVLSLDPEYIDADTSGHAEQNVPGGGWTLLHDGVGTAFVVGGATADTGLWTSKGNYWLRRMFLATTGLIALEGTIATAALKVRVSSYYLNSLVSSQALYCHTTANFIPLDAGDFDQAAGDLCDTVTWTRGVDTPQPEDVLTFDVTGHVATGTEAYFLVRVQNDVTDTDPGGQADMLRLYLNTPGKLPYLELTMGSGIVPRIVHGGISGQGFIG